MTSSSHSSRYWFNHVKNGITDTGTNADKDNEADWRYEFAVDSTTVVINNRKTYGENNMSASSMVEVEMNTVTIPSGGAQKLKITRCDIGYSVYVGGIALEKVA